MRRWLLVRRSTDDPEDRGFYQAYGPEGTPIEELVRVCQERWAVEVTFQEMRRHLGFESQRQWSDMAIRRTTPALLGLFSLVTLLAHQRMAQAVGAFRRQAAWYHKRHPTFWDSPASTDTFTLRDASFSYSILLVIGWALVAQRRV